MATLYCGPTSAGGNTGADFTNRIALPNTTNAVRGNTYVIIGSATGYGNYTFSTPSSGTTLITVRKANAAQDSAVAGWSSTFESLPATFGNILPATRYWDIDGKVRTETNRLEEPTGYGIRADSLSGNDTLVDAETASGSRFAYMEIGGTWDDGTTPSCSQTDSSAIRFVYTHHDITFERCCFHNRGSDNSAIAMVHGSVDFIYDHCDFYMGWGKATIASPNATCSGWIVRYCRFWNSSRRDDDCGTEGGGITCEVGSYSTGPGSEHVGHQFYGNIFYGEASGGRNGSIMMGDSSGTGGVAIDCLAYNNTFAGFPESCVLGVIFFYAGSGNIARNNLAYDITGSLSVTANTTSNNTKAVSDPFLDYANKDFRLSGHTANGTSIASPYNEDPLGNTRGADGTWDLGAYQFGDDPPPEGITLTTTNLNVTNLVIG
jgi:hypothetical protein